MNTKALAQLCRRVGTSLEAGIDTRRVWQSEVDRGGRANRRAAAHVSQRIAAGDTVADAMRSSRAFPPLACDLTEIGEQTGRLEETFTRLADSYDRQLSLRRTFLAGILWPMIQLVAAVVIIGLLILAMGWVQQMTGERIDVLGLGLVGKQGFAIYCCVIAAVFVLLALIYRQVASGGWAGGTIGRLLLNVPILGKCLRTMALARMAWTLSLTLNTPMATTRAVELALRSTNNGAYTSQIPAAHEAIQQGRDITGTLRTLGGYPSEFLDVVDVGEQTGQLSESLALLSRQYEDRAKAALNGLTVFAGFAVWGLVALLIVAMIFRLAMFYVNTINSLL